MRPKNVSTLPKKISNTNSEYVLYELYQVLCQPFLQRFFLTFLCCFFSWLSTLWWSRNHQSKECSKCELPSKLNFSNDWLSLLQNHICVEFKPIYDRVPLPYLKKNLQEFLKTKCFIQIWWNKVEALLISGTVSASLHKLNFKLRAIECQRPKIQHFHFEMRI